MSALRVVLMTAIGVLAVSAAVATAVRRPSTPLATLEVEVLNACAVNGLAARASDRLQALRQDVIAVENWADHEFATSFVIDRRGKPALTRRLARRIGPCPVVLERTDDPRADVTLVLGHDWASLRLFDADSGDHFAR